MRRIIKVNENDLHKIISETISQMIDEEYNGNKTPAQLANLVCDLLFDLMNEMKNGHQVEYGEIDNIHAIACDLTYALSGLENPAYDK